MTRARASLIGLIATLIAMAGIVIVAQERADATDGNVTGEPYCIDATHWGVVWTWNSTNVPAGVQAEVKAMTTSAGTLVAPPGHGVMSGSQVMLSAWTSHAINWPGVPTKTGNWSDQFSTVGIPVSVSSVTTTVQYDYDNGHSGDPTGQESNPGNCTPPVEEPPSPTPTPSDTPTPSVTPTPSPTPSETPSAPPTQTVTPSPTPTPTTPVTPTAPPTSTPTPPRHTCETHPWTCDEPKHPVPPSEPPTVGPPPTSTHRTPPSRRCIDKNTIRVTHSDGTVTFVSDHGVCDHDDSPPAVEEGL